MPWWGKKTHRLSFQVDSNKILLIFQFSLSVYQPLNWIIHYSHNSRNMGQSLDSELRFEREYIFFLAISGTLDVLSRMRVLFGHYNHNSYVMWSCIINFSSLVKIKAMAAYNIRMNRRKVSKMKCSVSSELLVTWLHVNYLNLGFKGNQYLLHSLYLFLFPGLQYFSNWNSIQDFKLISYTESNRTIVKKQIVYYTKITSVLYVTLAIVF